VVIPRLGLLATVIAGLGLLAAVIARLGVAAAVIAGLGVAAAVIAGLGVAAAVISELGEATVVVYGPGARRDLDRDALRERGIAQQAGNSGHACGSSNRRSNEQFLHGFFLPWDRLQVVKPGPRLDPPLASRPSTRQATALSTPTERAPGGPRFRPAAVRGGGEGLGGAGRFRLA
jgi:hypothetical protein